MTELKVVSMFKMLQVQVFYLPNIYSIIQRLCRELFLSDLTYFAKKNGLLPMIYRVMLQILICKISVKCTE
jgi:hypothetical protein